MKKFLVLLFLCAVSVLPALGQGGGGGGNLNPSSGSGLHITTVAGLASIAQKGLIATVTDGNSATDCTAGGASTVVACQYTGSGWVAVSSAGSMTWPAAAGIAVYAGGNAWGTSLTAPSGAIVGTSDTQTLTNKTLDGVSPTTMGFLDATSSIQTQLNGKAPLANPAFTGTATAVNLTTSGLLTTAASATGGAGFNLPPGAAPTTPNNGDLWTTTAGLFAQINGATVGPFGTGGGTPGGTNTAVQFNNSSAFGGDATNFFYNSSTHNLTLTGTITAAGFTATGPGAAFTQYTGSSWTGTAGTLTFGADSGENPCFSVGAVSCINVPGIAGQIGGTSTSPSVIGFSLTSEGYFGNQAATAQCPNDTTTGTTVNLLAKSTSTGCIVAGTSDTAVAVYPVTAGAGKSGSAHIAQIGDALLTMDGTASNVQGQYVIASTTAGGDGHTTGSTTQPTSGCWVGTMIDNSTTSGSTNRVQVEPGCTSSGGTVSTTGSPAANEVAVFSAPATITGTAADATTTHVLINGTPPAFGAITAAMIPASANTCPAGQFAGSASSGFTLSCAAPIANQVVLSGGTNVLSGTTFVTNTRYLLTGNDANSAAIALNVNNVSIGCTPGVVISRTAATDLFDISGNNDTIESTCILDGGSQSAAGTGPLAKITGNDDVVGNGATPLVIQNAGTTSPATGTIEVTAGARPKIVNVLFSGTQADRCVAVIPAASTTVDGALIAYNYVPAFNPGTASLSCFYEADATNSNAVVKNWAVIHNVGYITGTNAYMVQTNNNIGTAGTGRGENSQGSNVSDNRFIAAGTSQGISKFFGFFNGTVANNYFSDAGNTLSQDAYFFGDTYDTTITGNVCMVQAAGSNGCLEIIDFGRDEVTGNTWDGTGGPNANEAFLTTTGNIGNDLVYTGNTHIGVSGRSGTTMLKVIANFSSQTLQGLNITGNHFFGFSANSQNGITLIDTSGTMKNILIGPNDYEGLSTGVTVGASVTNTSIAPQTCYTVTTCVSDSGTGTDIQNRSYSGTVTLSGGTGTFTINAQSAFTSTSTFACSSNDTTTITNGSKAVPASTTTATVTGTGTDVISVTCTGH